MKLLSKKAFIFTILGVSVSAIAAQGTGTGGSKGSSNSNRSSGTTQSSPMGSNSGTTTTAPSNSAVGSGTTGPTTNTNPANPANPNNTGTSVYNNRTGAPDTTSTTTTPGTTTGTTRMTTRPNAAVTQTLTLDGMKAEDNTRVVQYARDAGALDARIEGNTLKYSGENFNQARFNSLMSSSFPSVNINR